MFCGSREVVDCLNMGVCVPKARTLTERFTCMVRERQTHVRKNITASGISEEYGELEQTLDTYITEMDTQKLEQDEKRSP